MWNCEEDSSTGKQQTPELTSSNQESFLSLNSHLCMLRRQDELVSVIPLYLFFRLSQDSIFVLRPLLLEKVARINVQGVRKVSGGDQFVIFK